MNWRDICESAKPEGSGSKAIYGRTYDTESFTYDSGFNVLARTSGVRPNTQP